METAPTGDPPPAGATIRVALIFSAAVVALGARAPIGLLLTAVAAGVWIAQGIVAGIPLDALTWLGIGLVAKEYGPASGKMAA